MRRKRKRYVNIFMVALLFITTLMPPTWAFAEEQTDNGTTTETTSTEENRPVDPASTGTDQTEETDSTDTTSTDTTSTDPTSIVTTPGEDVSPGTSPAENTPKTIKVEQPEQFTYFDGQLKIYNKNTEEARIKYSHDWTFDLSDLEIEDTDQFQLEIGAQLEDSETKKFTFFYDFKEITGEQLRELINWSIPEDAITVKPDFSDLALNVRSLSLISHVKQKYPTLADHFRIYDIETNILTSPKKLQLVLEGTDDQSNLYGLIKELDVTSETNSYSFTSEKEKAINLAANGEETETSLIRANTIPKDVNYSFHYGNELYKGFYVSPGNYELNLTTSTSIDNQIFTAIWTSNELTLTTQEDYSIPGIPDEMQPEYVNVYKNNVNFNTRILSKGFELSNIEEKGPISGVVKAYDSEDQLLQPEYTAQNLRYVEVPWSLSGEGKLTYSLMNGEEELVSFTKSFALEDEVDKELKGVVVTAQDENGNPLKDGSIQLYDRVNPKTYDTDFQHSYNLSLVYQGDFKEYNGNYEGFIPNAYLLAGREYELVVTGYTAKGEQIIYHKSIKADNLKTIEFSSKQLTKLNIKTAKIGLNGDISVTVIDKDQQAVISYPIFVNDGKNLYIQTDLDLQVNADLLDEKNDVGYYYSEIIQTEPGETSINLDELDTVQISAPQGVKMGIASSWSNDNQASLYHVSKNMYDAELGSKLAVLLFKQSEGYEVVFGKVITDLSKEISLDINPNFNGYISSIHYSDKEVGMDVEYRSEEEIPTYLLSILPNSAAAETLEDGEVTFNAVDENGEVTPYSVENNLYEATDEDPITSTAAEPSTLLKYSVTKGKQTKEVFTDDLTNLFFPLIDGEGRYEIKLVEQTFPETVAKLSMVEALELGDQPATQNGKFAIVSSNDEPVSITDVFLKSTEEVDGKTYNQQNYLQPLTSGEYEIPEYVQIDPEKQYYITVNGYLGTKQTTFYDYQKFTGKELLELKTYEISSDLKPVSFSNNHPEITGDIRYMLEFNLGGDGPTEVLSFYQWDVLQGNEFLLKGGDYTPYLTGTDDSASAYFLKGEQVDVNESSTFSFGNEKTVELSLEDNGKTTPFNSVMFNKNDTRVWVTGFSYPYNTGVLKRLYITPGEFDLGFQTISIEDNETPWAYELWTGLRNFSENTFLDISEGITADIVNLQTYPNGSNNYSINADIQLKIGELNLTNVGVFREQTQTFSLLRSLDVKPQPIREYEGVFDRFDYVPYTVSIENAQGENVLKTEYAYNIQRVNLWKKLEAGEYTFKYELPVGPNKTITASRVFKVSEEEQPFVTITKPSKGALTNSKEIEIAGETLPNETVAIKLYEEGKEEPISETSIQADEEGIFSSTIQVDKDGAYTLVANSTSDQIVISNRVSFKLDTTAPNQPANLKAEKTAEGVALTWDKIADATSYKIEAAIGDGEYQVIQDKVTTNQFIYKQSQFGKTYKFRVSAVDEANNVSLASEPVELITPDFAVSKIELIGAKNSYGLFRLGQELTIALTGAYAEEYVPKAQVTILANGEEKKEEVELTYNTETKKYEGKYTIQKGTTLIKSVEGWLINTADNNNETERITQPLSTAVGATLKGKVTAGGNDLAKKARVRLIGKNTISLYTDDNGQFEMTGIPEGEYSIDVIYDSNTFNNVLNKKLSFQAGGILELSESINVPAYQDLRIKFVAEENDNVITKPLKVRLSNSDGFVQYGFINGEGFFTTWDGQSTLKKIKTGTYTVKVYKEGIYKETSQNISVTDEKDYSATPELIKVQGITSEKTNVTIHFDNYEDIGSIDSISLFSWNAYKQFGYGEVGSYYLSYQDLEENGGTITIPDVVYADDYELYVYKEGYRQNSQSDIQINSTNNTISVELKKGLEVTGRLVSSDKNPITNGQVYAYSDTSYASAAVEQDGTFLLQGLAADEKVHFEASSTDYITIKRDYEQNEIGDLGDIELAKASYIEGKVLDKKGNPLKYVYVNAYAASDAEGAYHLGQYKGWARTGEDGYFKIYGLPEGEYDLEFSSYDYPNLIERKVATKTEKNYILQVKEGGNFVGEGNKLTASKQTVIAKEKIQYKLNYKNNGTADAENIPLKVNLPSNVELVEQSVLLNGQPANWNNGEIIVDKVDSGQSGSLTFEVTVNESEETNVYTTATINDTEENEAEVLNASTNILFVTLNAPSTSAQDKIKVYGNAKSDSVVEIYANNKLLTKVKVDGRWWFTDISLPVKDKTQNETFELVAKVKDGEQVVTSKPVQVEYSPSIPTIEDVTVYAGWNGEVQLNPYTGLATFAIVEKTPLDTDITFTEEIESASVIFLGKTYEMTTSDHKSFKFDGSLLGDWSSYGEQLLEISFTTKDGVTITLPLMAMIVLIDPSGYVFEGSMSEPLEGVIATVEEYKDSDWVPWNAEFFGQVNPQVTDENGRYGWDVNQGNWRVIFIKPGYEPTISRNIQVPPPETQLNVPLVRSTPPQIKTVAPSRDALEVPTGSNITVTFDRLMNVVDKNNNIKLYKVKGDERTPVNGAVEVTTVNGYKEVLIEEQKYYEEDSTKKLAKTFTFNPERDLDADATYEIEISGNIKDYADKTLGDTFTQRFTTAEASIVTPPIGGGGGGGGAIPPAAPPVEDKKVNIDDKQLKVDNGKATLDESAILEIINNAEEVERLVIKGTDSVKEFSLSTKLISALQEKNSNAVIELQSNVGSYSLPLKEINLASLKSKLNASQDENVELFVSLEASPSSMEGIKAQGLQALSEPIEFLVGARYNGKTEFVHRFSQLVEREINLDKPVDPAKATVVKLTENGFVTVPTIFKDGKAIIKSSSNSVYVVVQSDKTFKDVNNGKSWAEEYIESLASKYIIHGRTNDLYEPGSNITRGEFAALISRALGLTPSKAYNGEFVDVSGKEAINKNGELVAAYEAGIIKGKSGKRFAPNDKLTRLEAAVMIARALDHIGYDTKKLDSSKDIQSFRDDKLIGDWARPSVEKVLQAGIMSGSTNQNFQPNEFTKRDQMAKIIAETLSFTELKN